MKNGHPRGWPFSLNCGSCWLPDPDAILGLDVVGVAFLDAERVVPGVDVAEGGEGADHAGGVGVADDELAKLAVAEEGAPDLAPAEEDTLLAGKAVEHRCRLTVQRDLVGLQGQQDPAEVADVLTHGLASGDVHAGELR